MQGVSTPNPCIVQGSSLFIYLHIWMFSQLRYRSFVWFLTWNVVISIEFLVEDYRTVLRLLIHIFKLSFRKVEPVLILTSIVWNCPCSFMFSLYERSLTSRYKSLIMAWIQRSHCVQNRALQLNSHVALGMWFILLNYKMV